MKKSLGIVTPFLRTAMRYFFTTFTIIFLLSELVFATKSRGQQLSNTTINLSASQKTIIEIIEEIESKTKLKFVYNPDELNTDERFGDINFKKEKIVSVFKNLGYQCKEEGEHIIIKRTSFLEQNKDITVTGTVKDKTGLGLPGVSVTIKGAQKGVSTDATGTYSITVDENATLVFSMLGFLKQEIAVDGRTSINVIMREGQLALTEVVVVGYGTQKREEVTSAITTVRPEDFNQGGSRSPIDLIRGKVPGLSITRVGGNNNPNSGPSIQMRGINTYGGTSTSPLIIIDGIPGGDLGLLQQDDIESFSILKDGSAAAIYGTRANAGVIIITTKKGKAGEPRFDYATYFSRDQVRSRPDVLTADEFRALMSDSSFPARGADGGASVDYYDLLLDKNNLSQYHNLAASGGTANTNYRASLFYADLNGIALRNGNKQYGGRFNFNQRGLKDRLSLQANIATKYTYSDNIGGNGGDFEQAVQQNPTTPVMNSEGIYNDTPNDAYYYNPIARINQEEETGTRQTLSGDVKFSFDVYKGLKVSIFGAVVRSNYLEEGYRDKLSRLSVRENLSGGYARKSNSLGITRTVESVVEYSRVLLAKHSVNTILGYTYQDGMNTSFNAANTGFISDAYEDNKLDAGGTVLGAGKGTLGSSKESNKLIAFFGRFNYTYNEKYMASFVLRHEGSTRFGKNNKWGNFPAISAGWNISKEGFMENVKVVNDLKLRVGYGITGNQNISSYQSLVTLGQGGIYFYNNGWAQTYGPDKNPNPDLRWERKKELNIGTDFSLLKRKLSGSIDVYKRRTEDLLASYNAQVPAFVTPTIYTNVGSIENKGVELALSTTPLQRKNFKWDIDFTANTQRNKITSISNDTYKGIPLNFGQLTAPGSLGFTIRGEEGGPMGNFYGKRFAGFTSDGKWLFYKADGSTATTANITPDDFAVLGNGIPKYMGSLTNRFIYKKFDLSVFLRGKFDYDILNLQDLYYANPTVSNNLLQSAITRHSQLRDSYQYSDYYIEKGDFVRLDNVTLGYNLKLKTSYVRNLRVYGSCQNVATFTKYTGLDPEVQDTGISNTGIENRTFYPYTRTFTLGLNVGF